MEEAKAQTFLPFLLNGQEYTLLCFSMNVEKEKDKRTNGEVGHPNPPFQASSPRRAGQA